MEQFGADTILYNGNVITLDKNDSLAQAVALKNGRILGVGSDRKWKISRQDTRK